MVELHFEEGKVEEIKELLIKLELIMRPHSPRNIVARLARSQYQLRAGARIETTHTLFH